MARFRPPSWLVFAALLVLACICLWPGATGGFLFDDFPNLASLGRYGRIDNWPALARYLTSGEADPLGRPVALATFLLDARNWPADPFAFKRTNIFLHLFNGMLLFAALRELGNATRMDAQRASRAATIAASLWLLHPLFLSTVLYVVQREAMLPATFTFAALWLWLRARRRYLAGNTGGLSGMWLIVPACTALATLSKVNGALLPALLLIVECRLPVANDARHLRPARIWLLWVPAIAVTVGVLVAAAIYSHGVAATRGWTLGQRLLSEPRVLFDYLCQLWLPRPLSPGLFNDGYVVSTDWMHPWTTLPAIAGLFGLGLVAWHWRNRQPALSLAIGFYLVGQSIESGPLPLELYFEHRNYLPAALMFWPLALWLTNPDTALPSVRAVTSIGLPLLLAGMTWLGASVWGNASGQAMIWGERNPNSPRAQAYLAQWELNQGRVRAAEARLRTALRSHPTEVQLVANLIDVRCRQGFLDKADLAAAVHSFSTNPDPTRLSFRWLQGALPMAEGHTCGGFGLPEAGQLAHAFADNPSTPVAPGRRSDAMHLLGEVALASGNAHEALADFNAAWASEQRIDTVLVQAAMLASAGLPRLALDHLQLASTPIVRPWYRWRSMTDVHRWVLHRQGFWQQQIDELRGKITSDLVHSP